MGIYVDGLNPIGNYFVFSPNRVNLMLDIAKGKTNDFNDGDKSEVAEFIKRGFVSKTGNELSLKFPIFTSKQYNINIDQYASTGNDDKSRDFMGIIYLQR